MIRLTHYGKDVLLKVFVSALCLIILSLFIENSVVKFILIGLMVILWIFTLYFFRDPERELPRGLKENQVVSPADGKIVLIENVVNKEKNIFSENVTLKQVSIFLSPLDVHVNRIPINGVIRFLKYIKGDYIVAFDHKSSERNERLEIGIVNNSLSEKLLFKQIAGFVARRIVYDLNEGNEVHAGERFGMIKFGSRVDILMKSDSKILVNIDQKVVGGETIIAEL